MNMPSIDSITSSNMLSSPFLIGNIGIPLIAGMVIGYLARKMFHTALMIGGVIIAILFFAEYFGVFGVSGEQLQYTANATTGAVVDTGNFFMAHMAGLTATGISAAIGFFMGFTRG